MEEKKIEREVFLVTGGSGYVGKILLEKLILDSRVEKIILIDKDDLRKDLKENKKIIFIHKNLADNSLYDWESEVKKIEVREKILVTKVVHLAWQIRRLDISDPELCLRVFKSNRDAGLLLFAGLLMDAVMRAAA